MPSRCFAAGVQTPAGPAHGACSANVLAPPPVRRMCRPLPSAAPPTLHVCDRFSRSPALWQCSASCSRQSLLSASTRLRSPLVMPPNQVQERRRLENPTRLRANVVTMRDQVQGEARPDTEGQRPSGGLGCTVPGSWGGWEGGQEFAAGQNMALDPGSLSLPPRPSRQPRALCGCCRASGAVPGPYFSWRQTLHRSLCSSGLPTPPSAARGSADSGNRLRWRSNRVLPSTMAG